MKFSILFYSSLFILLISCSSKKNIDGQWIVKYVSNTSWKKEKELLMQTFDSTYTMADKAAKRIETEETITNLYDSLKRDFIGNVYEFKSNKNAYITMNGQIDSVKWAIEDNELILDEPAMKGTGEALRYSYTLLSDSLTLKLVLMSDTMTLILKRN